MRIKRRAIFDAIIASVKDGVTEITNEEIWKAIGEYCSHATVSNLLSTMEKAGNAKVSTYIIRDELGRIVSTRRRIEIFKVEFPSPPPKKSYVTIGVNDIATTHPNVLHWLVDKEDGHKYSHGCEAYIQVKCPACGYEKRIVVSDLCNSGFNCPYCSDKISYPNKYVRAFLKQLPIENMKVEYKDDWTQGRWYDNYFEYNGQRYVVEVDGNQHERDTQWSSYEYQLNTDKLKDRLAIENGFNIIRIPCGRSRNYKIKETLLNSQFNEIFDLSGIDWELCAKKATENKVIAICNYFRNHPDASNAELKKIFEVCEESISSALKKGKELGIVDYNPIERQKRQCRLSIAKANEARKIKYIYDVYSKEGTHICTFSQLKQVMNYMNENYNANFNRGGIGYAFRRQNKNKVYYKEFILERRQNVS